MGVGTRGDVLERGECLIGLEGLRDVLSTLCTQVVAQETASVSRIEASWATDSKRRACAGDSRMFGCGEAYSSEVSVLLVLRASETCIAPCSPNLLPARLQTRSESGQRVESGGLRKCPWLLTAGLGVGGDVLELFQGCVGLEGLRDLLSTLCLELVPSQTAKASRIEVLLATDSRRLGRQWRT